MSGREAIIIAARRTAIGKVGGLHARRSLDELAAPVIQAVLADIGLDADKIDEIVLGNAIGGGGNPARLIALAAGLPESVAAITLDRQCASGLDAIVMSAHMIASGAADAVIAGGAESASTAPWRIAKPANLYTELPHFFSQPAFTPSVHGDPGMIEAAENVARQEAISRERQDAFALESHRRAIEAARAGIFQQEIVPLGEGPQERHDEGPRASLSAGLLARMRPLLCEDGTVTAGNSCQINDGAAVVLIVSRDLHQKLGSPPGLVLVNAASAGVPPRLLGLAGIPAARKASIAANVPIPSIGAVEVNEAFASQTIATADQLDLDPSRLNIFGGALAYGHPYGASGAVLVARLFTRLARTGATRDDTRTGMAIVAAAGGLGTAAIFNSTSS